MRTYRRRVTRRAAAPMRRRTTQTRRAFGNFASAMQQRDSTNVVISCQEDVVLNMPHEANEVTLVRNCNALLINTPYFENYMGMYDQYKINAIRASMEMTNISNELLSATKFPSVCTAWDRNGIKISSVQTNPGVQPGNEVYAYCLPSYQEVCSYSSANEKTIYYGSRWGVIRQLDAASMMEKSIYLPTTNTRDVLSHGNMYASWNPMLLIAIKASTTDPQLDRASKISIHWQFDVTLRGLRKVAVDNLDKFKPNAGFIGFNTSTDGLAVLKPGANPNAGQPYALSGAAGAAVPPNINPEYQMPNAAAGNGLVVPNTGLPGANTGL